MAIVIDIHGHAYNNKKLKSQILPVRMPLAIVGVFMREDGCPSRSFEFFP